MGARELVEVTEHRRNTIDVRDVVEEHLVRLARYDKYVGMRRMCIELLANALRDFWPCSPVTRSRQKF